ncbi:MAG: MFS transporter [Limnobacter sp.]|nr:MFS transporter [Limnobacter sp.]
MKSPLQAGGASSARSPAIQLAWLGLFYAAYFGFVGLYTPFLGPYLKSTGHGLNVIALALGSMQAMRIVGPLIWGWLADRTRLRVRWLRLGALAGLVCSGFVFLEVHSTVALLLAIVCMNLAVSGLVPLADAHAMDVCHGSPGMYGRVRVYGSVGFVATVLGFGWCADFLGYTSYAVWVWCALALAFVAACGFQEPGSSRAIGYFAASSSPELPNQHFSVSSNVQAKPQLSRSRFGLRLLLQPRDLQLFWLAAFFMLFAHGVLYAFFSLYLQEYGYSEFRIGFLWAFGVVCEIVFFALQRTLFHKLSLVMWLRVSFLACAVRFAMLAAFPGFSGCCSWHKPAIVSLLQHTTPLPWPGCAQG